MNVVRSVLLFLWWCWPVTCLKMQMEHLICWPSWFASLISHPNFPSNCPGGLPDGLLLWPVWSRLQGNSLTIFCSLWGAGGSDPIREILPNLRDFFPNLNGSIILNRYLKMQTKHFKHVDRNTWQNCQSINNTGRKTGDVERSPDLAPPLDPELWRKSWSWESRIISR